VCVCVCVCVNFDFIEFGGMTQRKFWYGLWYHSTLFNIVMRRKHLHGMREADNAKKTIFI